MNKKVQVIFDFDGVILSSHKVKTEGFYFIFKKFGKVLARKAQNYHENHTGISRYKKFKFLKKKFFKNKNLTLEKLDKSFKKYCLEKILSLRVNKYLLKFLQSNSKKYDFFISTGTPQKEIVEILKRKKLVQYFKKVYGSPESKINHINNIKKKISKKDIYWRQ